MEGFRGIEEVLYRVITVAVQFTMVDLQGFSPSLMVDVDPAILMYSLR